MTDPFLTEQRKALEQRFDEVQKRVREARTQDDAAAAAMQVLALKNDMLELMTDIEQRFVDGFLASRCLTNHPNTTPATSSSSST